METGTGYTLAAAVLLNGALGVRPALSCSGMDRKHDARMAMSDGEPGNHGAAATSDAKPRIGDEVACAMGGMKMQLSADTPSAEYNGKTYYYCSDSEKKKFLSTPEHYTVP